MSDDQTLYAVYASKDIAPPATSYWASRRRLARLMRELQETLQTTEVSIGELEALGEVLQQQLQTLADKPRLFGRPEWAQSGRYGEWGSLQTETTPILGPSNPISPAMSIWFEEDRALATVTFNWMYEGADCIVHGGWVAAVFDEFLGTAQILAGKAGMTGSLATRYHRPTPIGRELNLTARVKSVEGRKITMLGEMWAGDVMIASCEGLFVLPEKAISPAFG